MSHRLSLVLLFLAALVVAQKPEEKKDRPALALPTSDRYASHLEVATKNIADKDWAIATTLIQKLLDLEDPTFTTVARKESKVIVDVHTAAERLLAEMPKEGRAFYEEEYGAKAAELLKQARLFGDARQLAEVMTRYGHTRAGLEATERLATHLLDRNQVASAARAYDRLLARGNAEGLSPLTLFRAALAYHRLGDRERHEQVWKSLTGKLKDGNLEVGRKMLTLDELKKEIEKQTPAVKAPSEWRLFRGDAARNASSNGGIPFLEPTWKFDLFNEIVSKEWLKRATDFLNTAKQPVLSSSHPLAVVLRRGGGGAIPLVVYRSYWGVHTRALTELKGDEIRAGEVYWEAPAAWSLDRMLKEPKYVGTLNQWLQAYVEKKGRPGILLENSTHGTLSADGVRVYLVEDFQVPPHSLRPAARFPEIGFGGALGQAIGHNRLQAYDLDSGKLMWEIGSTEAKDDLAESFFLSTPLTLEGKLFVLNEKDSDLRLLTLDPPSGRVLSVRKLATFRDSIHVERHRRFLAAHLAHAEGVLVAPTHADSVLGVDALTGRLLWVHSYGETRRPEKPQGGIGPLAVPRDEAPAVEKTFPWRDSVPMIAKGRVVYAPSDGNSVLCLSLRDGRLLWKQARKEGDVYLAGIVGDHVLIVGKDTCRAVNLSDGTLAWVIDTGRPSGLGVAVEGQYYLPLAASLAISVPEICVIDVAKGRVAAHVRSRRNEAIGNLLFHDGTLISQTTTTIAAYPLRKAEQKIVEDLLKKKENDAVALAKRGDLKLDRGDLKGAIEDYLAARRNDPPKELQPRLHRNLFEALMEYLQKDFDAALPHLKAAEELSKDDPTSDRAELSRRRRAILIIAGRGFEKQKKLVEAARFFLDLIDVIDVATERELIEVPGEQGLRVSPAVHARRQLEKVLEAAGAEDRKKIEQEIVERLRKRQSNRFEIDPLNSFVAAIGVRMAAGREARLELAERLAQKREFMEAQRYLLEVLRQKHDRTDAGKAVHALARLCSREGLLADAVAYYRELGRDFGDVVILDKKTGKDLLEEIVTDKRLIPYLETSGTVPAKMGYKATEKRGNFSLASAVDELEREGAPMPFFDRHLLGLQRYRNQLVLRERQSNEERWSKSFPMYHYLHLLRAASVRGEAEPKARFQNLGHLVIVTLGHRAITLDPVKYRLLWEKDLWGWMEEHKVPTYRSHVIDPRDGSLRIHYDAWIQRIPARGLASPDAVVMQRVSDLIGVEPLTGRVLWSRTGISDAAELFHDGEQLYVVETDDKREPTKTHVLDIRNGESLKVPDFAKLYRQRLRSHGRTLLLSETDDRGALTLRQHDLIAGKDLWTKTFAPRSLVLETEDDALAGAVQRDGKVFVFDLDKGKEVMRGEMRAEHFKDVEAVHAIRDARGYYLACRKPLPKEVLYADPNLMPDAGLRGVMVNGDLLALANDGTPRWSTPVERLWMVFNRFHELPVIVLSGREQQNRLSIGVGFLKGTATRVVEKKTGKPVFDIHDESDRAGQLHTISLDEKTGAVEVLRSDLQLRLEPR